MFYLGEHFGDYIVDFTSNGRTLEISQLMEHAANPEGRKFNSLHCLISGLISLPTASNTDEPRTVNPDPSTLIDRSRMTTNYTAVNPDPKTLIGQPQTSNGVNLNNPVLTQARPILTSARVVTFTFAPPGSVQVAPTTSAATEQSNIPRYFTVF